MIMMCAFGVPGNIRKGPPTDGFAEIPIGSGVAEDGPEFGDHRPIEGRVIRHRTLILTHRTA